MLSMENEYFFFFMLSLKHIKATEAMYVWLAFIPKWNIFVIGLQFKLYLTLKLVHICKL